MYHSKNTLAYSKNGAKARLTKLADERVSIIVEGHTDATYWNKLVKSSDVRTIIVEGKKNVIETVSEVLNEGGPKNRIIGVHDEDYEQFLPSPEPGHSNLFSTRLQNDMESLLAEYWLSKDEEAITIVRDLRAIPIPKQKVHSSMTIAKGIGILRAKNSLEGWGLKFREEGAKIQGWLRRCVDHHQEEGWEEDHLVSSVLDNSDSCKVSLESCIDGYREAAEEFSDLEPSMLTNGHDFTKILEILCENMVRSSQIEEWLRNLGRPDSKRFELFKRLEAWAKGNKVELFR